MTKNYSVPYFIMSQIQFNVLKKEGSSATSSPALRVAETSRPQDDSLKQVEEQCLRCLQDRAHQLAQDHSVSVSSIMNAEVGGSSVGLLTEMLCSISSLGA